MTFEENLKRICKDRGTTPTAIMKKWGLSTSKVSAWYKGSLPKQEMLIRLAEELNCSVMDFFADEEVLKFNKATQKCAEVLNEKSTTQNLDKELTETLKKLPLDLLDKVQVYAKGLLAAYEYEKAKTAQFPIIKVNNEPRYLVRRAGRDGSYIEEYLTKEELDKEIEKKRSLPDATDL